MLGTVSPKINATCHYSLPCTRSKNVAGQDDIRFDYIAGSNVNRGASGYFRLMVPRQLREPQRHGIFGAFFRNR